MKNVVNEFKIGVGNLLDEMYQEMDNLMNDALFGMKFCYGDIDKHYTMLQDALVEVLQEKLEGLYDKIEKSN